jgi:quinoprotein glucose dehydrogenase
MSIVSRHFFAIGECAMNVTISRQILAPWMAVMAVVACAAIVSAQRGTTNGEWPTYGGDLGNTKYAPLDQITAANFNSLEIAWRFKTDNLGPRPEFQFEGTPLMVKGVVYSTGGTRRAVVALDAATGEQLWIHSENEGARGAAAPRQLSGRGLAYWSDGKEERILYVTPGYRLVALDAKTGNRVPSFGTNGIVDLKQNDDQTIDLMSGEIGLHASPVVAPQRRHRRRRASIGRRADRQDERQGIRARIRRAHRQAPVDLPHDSRAG